MLHANNKGADQPAHLRSLISTFIVCCMDTTIPLVSTSEISNLYLASVAEEAGLSLPWLQTRKTGFLMTGLMCSKPNIVDLCLYLYVSTFPNFHGLRAYFHNSEGPALISKILKRNTGHILGLCSRYCLYRKKKYTCSLYRSGSASYLSEGENKI